MPGVDRPAQVQPAPPATDSDPDGPEGLLAVADQLGSDVGVRGRILSEAAQELFGLPGGATVRRVAGLATLPTTYHPPNLTTPHPQTFAPPITPLHSHPSHR